MKFLKYIKLIKEKLKYLRLKAGLDSFVIAIIGVIILASFWWEPGVYKGKITLNDIGNVGVSVIFFFYGLKLSPQELKKGLANWKLHLVVQSAIFVIFPLVVLLLMAIFGSFGDKLLWLGVFYLAALPSTVSSSVVMTSIARGNITSAIFNASISSLLGVFITPIWMGLMISSSNGNFDLTDVIIKLSLQVLLPVIVGILLHSKFGKLAIKNSNKLRKLDQSIILLIVYASFCDSFANKMFSGYPIWVLFALGIAMLGLFFIVYAIITFIGKILHFSTEDHITAVFCGSKKSLVHGTVMSKVLFTGMSGVGVILLPLMMFHALQLVVVSIIAQKFAKRKD